LVFPQKRLVELNLHQPLEPTLPALLAGFLFETNVMQANKSHSVFLSHASKDHRLAKQVVEILERQGIGCWIAPRDIAAGSSYGEEIAKAIEKSSVFLLLLTDASNTSMPVANEVERAFSYQKTIIPLRVREISPSKKIEYYISASQWVDAFSTPLVERLDYIAAVVQAVEQKQGIPELPVETPSFSNRMRRFFEGFGRNPIGYSLGLVGLVLLAALVGMIGFAGVKTNELLDEGNEAYCRALMPMRPDNIVCDKKLVTQAQKLFSMKNGLLGELATTDSRDPKLAKRKWELAQDFDNARRHADLAGMERVLANLEAMKKK
jgi:hypothetical protein